MHKKHKICKLLSRPRKHHTVTGQTLKAASTELGSSLQLRTELRAVNAESARDVHESQSLPTLEMRSSTHNSGPWRELLSSAMQFQLPSRMRSKRPTQLLLRPFQLAACMQVCEVDLYECRTTSKAHVSPSSVSQRSCGCQSKSTGTNDAPEARNLSGLITASNASCCYGLAMCISRRACQLWKCECPPTILARGMSGSAATITDAF